MRSLTARVALACGLAVAAANTAARAEEGVAIKNLLGSMGIVPRDKDPIRYRERAPLVIPPKGVQLREPAAPESFASANPQWPDDPDVSARRKRAAEERVPVMQGEIRRMTDNNPRLTIDEIRAGRSAGSGERREAGWFKGDNSREALYLTPQQLRAGTKNGSDATDETPGAEPARRVLTEPPSGMRRSARNKALPNDFQVRGDQQQADASPLNWITKRFSTDDEE